MLVSRKIILISSLTFISVYIFSIFCDFELITMPLLLHFIISKMKVIIHALRKVVMMIKCNNIGKRSKNKKLIHNVIYFIGTNIKP